ncbi:MAG TPA: Flp family type IVb pilin [Pseudoneobacillus sp.]|nr:Flp family type IVb pilin [Pseudoneobacillus sp.]
MMKKMKALFVEEQGQGMTEYGLVLGVIAVAAVATLILLKDQVSTLFTDALTSIKTATGK